MDRLTDPTVKPRHPNTTKATLHSLPTPTKAVLKNKGDSLNNPYSIKGFDKWEGSKPGKGTFVEFDNLAYSTRAALKILNTYSNNYKIATIDKFVNRYVTPTEGNDVVEYKTQLAELTGYGIGGYNRPH